MSESKVWASGSLINSGWLNEVDALRFDADGAKYLSYTPAGTGAQARTVANRLGDTVSVKDFGAVGDGVTDDTAAILLAANSGAKVISIPENVLFDRTLLLASLPSGVVCLDWSSINDFTFAGQTSKHVGIITSDIAESDTHWAIDSGHHAILTTNNFGTSATTSASERKASWLWAVGQYQLGGLTHRGFRGAAIQQFTKESGDTFWKWGIRSIAPWSAIAGEYEEWATGQVISGAGVYRVGTTSQHYVSTGAGTTGATPPTHTSGTVSDGGVSWTWVDSADRTLFQCDEYGRWILGSGTSGNATFQQKVGLTDPAGNYRFIGASRGISKYAQFVLNPTDSGGAESAQPFVRAEDGVGLRVMKSDGSTDLARFSDSAGFGVHASASLSSGTINSATGSTPSVANTGTIYIGNSGVTSITDLANPVNDQIVHLVFTNANTTLVHSSTFMLSGSVNVTPTAYSVVTMKRVHSSVSGRWIELSRSIK